MSDAPYYPPLDEKTILALQTVQALAQQHPSYWLAAPYSGKVQMILEPLLRGAKQTPVDQPTSVVAPKRADEEDWEFLYRESRALYDGLQTAKGSLEGSELMAYYRTSTSLLEKLLGMQERANNLKHVSDFYQVVMDIMESTLTGDQRTQVMQKLAEASKAQ